MGLSNPVILVLLIPSRMPLAHDLAIHGNVIIDDDDEEDIPTAHAARQNDRKDDVLGDSSSGTHPRPRAPGIHYLPGLNKLVSLYCHLLHPFNMNGIRSAEQEKALCELGEKLGASELEVYKSPEVREIRKLASTNGRLEVGSSSILDELDNVQEQLLDRRWSRSRSMSSGSVEFATEIGRIPSIPEQRINVNHQQSNGNEFHSDELVSLYCHLLRPFNTNGIRSAKQEKALCELGEKLGASELEVYKSPEVREIGKLDTTNGRDSTLEVGSSSILDELDNVQEQPLDRRRSRSRSMSSGSVECAREIGCIPSIPEQRLNVNHRQSNGNEFHSDEF